MEQENNENVLQVKLNGNQLLFVYPSEKEAINAAGQCFKALASEHYRRPWKEFLKLFFFSTLLTIVLLELLNFGLKKFDIVNSYRPAVQLSFGSTVPATQAAGEVTDNPASGNQR